MSISPTKLSAFLLLTFALCSCSGQTAFSRALSAIHQDSEKGPVIMPNPILPAPSPVPSAVASSDPDSAWIGEVEGCIERLKSNQYSLGSNELDCTQGIAFLDCSGFVNDVAQVYFPNLYKELSARGRPTVSTYYDALLASSDSDLADLKSVKELQAGDILTLDYGAQKRVQTQATGHMMLILSQAELVSTDVYKVLVADSAESPHEDDTRKAGQTGLGIGSVYIQTNANLAPIALGWSDDKDWDTADPIALGRMLNNAK